MCSIEQRERCRECRVLGGVRIIAQGSCMSMNINIPNIIGHSFYQHRGCIFKNLSGLGLFALAVVWSVSFFQFHSYSLSFSRIVSE